MSTTKTIDWKDLAATSHYQTAVAVEGALQRGDVRDATQGIQELIDALSRADRRAVRSHLVVLMRHIIKWQSQPERRSKSWRLSIRNARREIEAIREETPSINREAIERIWPNCFHEAKENAEDEMDRPSDVDCLNWQDVFETEYRL